MIASTSLPSMARSAASTSSSRARNSAVSARSACLVLLWGDMIFAAFEKTKRDRAFVFSAPQVYQDRSPTSGRWRQAAVFSSNIINMPGSPNSVTPRRRNSTSIIVLHTPALPQTRMGCPAGKPPPLISSSPWITIGQWTSHGDKFWFVFGSSELAKACSFLLI